MYKAGDKLKSRYSLNFSLEILEDHGNGYFNVKYQNGVIDKILGASNFWAYKKVKVSKSKNHPLTTIFK